MIDSSIEMVIDLAVSPAYEQDGVMFLLAWGNGYSLWRGENNRWERVLSSRAGEIDCIDYVLLSPDYSDSHTLYLAGSSGGSPVIWRSGDGGQSFVRRSAPLYIDCWTIAADDAFFIAGFDGSHGIVYRTTTGGKSYSPAFAGSCPISSLALSSAYEQDGTLLAGNSYGGVFISTDNGGAFEALPQLSGVMKVAFDAQYADNGIIYAAGDSPDGGIYRLVAGEDDSWEAIDGTLAAGGMIGGLCVADNGALYAANFQLVDIEDNTGGLERCLEPALAGEFETVTAGLDDDAALEGLWLCGSRLWSFDATHLKLMTFNDSLAQPVELALPLADDSDAGDYDDGEVNIRLDWETLGTAGRYQWQISEDDNFASQETDFGGTTTASSVSLSQLEPDTTYYWRVRACRPLLSYWSEAWSFTTAAQEGDNSGIEAPEPESPANGATDVQLNPIFRWSDAAAAEGYELLISTEAGCGNPVIAMAGDYSLSRNSWQPDINLCCDTTYYWKIRAADGEVYSQWSEAVAFTTGAGAATEPPLSNTPPAQTVIVTQVSVLPPPVITPPPPPAQTSLTQTTITQRVTETVSKQVQVPADNPGWLYCVIGGMGAVIAVLLLLMLVLVFRKRGACNLRC